MYGMYLFVFFLVILLRLFVDYLKKIIIVLLWKFSIFFLIGVNWFKRDIVKIFDFNLFG